MTASAIPTVIDQLIATFESALGSGYVFDGPGATADMPTDFVIVGMRDPDDPVMDEAASTEQGWAWLGHVMRDETIHVHCAAVSWNGDGNQKTARDGVFTIMGHLTDAIQSDPTFAQTGTLWVQSITTTTLKQSQGDDGAAAVLSFDVTVRARVS